MTVRGNCGGSGARLGFWRGSSDVGAGRSAFSSASIASRSVLSKSSSKLPCAGLICSLRFHKDEMPGADYSTAGHLLVVLAQPLLAGLPQRLPAPLRKAAHAVLEEVGA